MNKRMGVLFSLCLMSVSLKALAAEAVSFPAPVLNRQAVGNSVPFSMTVTPDGRLVTKPGTVFTEGLEASDVTLPYLISTPTPIQYPRWAQREGWQGGLVIAIEVLKDGSVGRWYVMKSTGHVRLDQAVVSAVKSWKFQSAMQQGKPVVTCVQLPVRFEIQP